MESNSYINKMKVGETAIAVSPFFVYNVIDYMQNYGKREMT